MSRRSKSPTTSALTSFTLPECLCKATNRPTRSASMVAGAGMAGLHQVLSGGAFFPSQRKQHVNIRTIVNARLSFRNVRAQCHARRCGGGEQKHGSCVSDGNRQCVLAWARNAGASGAQALEDSRLEAPPRSFHSLPTIARPAANNLPRWTRAVARAAHVASASCAALWYMLWCWWRPAPAARASSRRGTDHASRSRKSVTRR